MEQQSTQIDPRGGQDNGVVLLLQVPRTNEKKELAAEQMFASINKIERSIESVMQVPDSELFTIDPMTLDDAALDAYVERLKNAGR